MPDKLNSTEKIFTEIKQEDYQADSDDSNTLEIDLSESPKHRPELNSNDKLVLEDLEEEIERQLDEKAAKSNLSAINVKNILRHIISNKHVLAMLLRPNDGHDSDLEEGIFEPKITRSKAKELMKNHQNVTTVKRRRKRKSGQLGVQILINEELPEETDDDEEYIPPKRIKLETKKHLTASTHDNSTQTNWVEDGQRKDTPVDQKSAVTNEIIAQRTRSKLSLSDTPLEVIEENFIPPDITTDMYNFECDDEEWKKFLQQFTKPLEEAVPPTQEDDDEADPEYNILADEDLDAFDLEELRRDKAVQITKKELQTLVTELLECSDTFMKNKEKENDANQNNINGNQQTEKGISENVECNNSEDIANFNGTQENLTQQKISFHELPKVLVASNGPVQTYCGTSKFQFSEVTEIPLSEVGQDANGTVICELVIDDTNIPVMNNEIRLLFEQQMRQHIQMLAQNFALTYEHPEYSDMALSFKNMLMSLRELKMYKNHSMFDSYHLQLAVEFITDWENCFKNKNPEALKCKAHVQDVIDKSIKAREACREFVPTLPDFYMKKVSASSVFIYPSLLPKIPFRCDWRSTKTTFVKGEDELIALGLEQFYPYVENHDDFKHKKKTRFGTRVRLADVANFISKYMMPHKATNKIHGHIKNLNENKAAANPIKYYFKNKEAPKTMHFVMPLEHFGVVPPAMRPREMLHYQWSKFLDPENTGDRYQEVYPQTSDSRALRPIAPAQTQLQVHLTIAESALLDETEVVESNSVINLAEIKSEQFKAQKNSQNDNESNIVLTEVTVQERNRINIKSEQLTQDNGSVEPCSPELENSQVTEDSFRLEELIRLPKKHREKEIRREESFVVPSSRGVFHSLNLPQSVWTPENITPTLKDFKFDSSVFRKLKNSNTDNMLPSMPLIPCSPANTERDWHKPEKVTVKVERRDDGEQTNSETENFRNKKDDEEEINALMVASSTMQNKNRRLPANSAKKAKQMREYNATLSMLCPEDPVKVEEKATNYAQAFYDKVQERLENDCPLKYQRFMEVLSEHDESVSSVSELYGKIESVLSPQHSDLCEEFLTFLTPEQAKQIGKLVPHFLLSNMTLFLRKLEIYYNNQPAQLRRIYNSLTELAELPDVTMEKVRATVLPLLKGNSLLIDWFLQMFPHERPPESLMTDWEQASCDDGDDVDNNGKMFETITLPEVEDPYGGPNCICKCHNLDNEMYATRARHCIPCGTKFLQGRVYVQTGKGLRLAHVSFNNLSSSNEDKRRLNVNTESRAKRKSDSSPSKVLSSPTKHDEEPRNSNESEDDFNSDQVTKKSKCAKPLIVTSSPKIRKKQIKQPKTNKTKKLEPINTSNIKKGTAKSSSSIKISLKLDESTSTSEPQEKSCVSTSSPDEKVVDVKGEKERAKSESTETENDTIEWEDKTSPGPSVESMDTCEESSQDTLDAPGSDTDNDSINEVESITSENSDASNDDAQTDGDKSQNWTRDEDKVILQIFQEHGGKKNVFNEIHDALPDRSMSEIRTRFHSLMMLLKKIASEATE